MRTIVLIALALLLLVSPLFAGDPPPVGKSPTIDDLHDTLTILAQLRDMSQPNTTEYTKLAQAADLITTKLTAMQTAANAGMSEVIGTWQRERDAGVKLSIIRDGQFTGTNTPPGGKWVAEGNHRYELRFKDHTEYWTVHDGKATVTHKDGTADYTATRIIK